MKNINIYIEREIKLGSDKSMLVGTKRKSNWGFLIFWKIH